MRRVVAILAGGEWVMAVRSEGGWGQERISSARYIAPSPVRPRWLVFEQYICIRVGYNNSLACMVEKNHACTKRRF